MKFDIIRLFTNNHSRNRVIAFYDGAIFLGGQIEPDSLSDPNFFSSDISVIQQFIDQENLSSGAIDKIKIPTVLTLTTNQQ